MSTSENSDSPLSRVMRNTRSMRPFSSSASCMVDLDAVSWLVAWLSSPLPTDGSTTGSEINKWVSTLCNLTNCSRAGRCGSNLKVSYTMKVTKKKLSIYMYYEIVLKWTPQNTFDDESTFVQVMAWCLEAPSHYLSQCWLRFTSPYIIISPQWVKQWSSTSIMIKHYVCILPPMKNSHTGEIFTHELSRSATPMGAVLTYPAPGSPVTCKRPRTPRHGPHWGTEPWKDCLLASLHSWHSVVLEIGKGGP